jgi:hypothetical protein
VLLSQDEARFPLVPTLRATLGVKGYRPLVGTWDNKEQVYCLAVLNVVTGQLTSRLLEQPARSKAKTGQSKQQRLQVAFAAHLRDIARAYPARQYPEVVITLDNAPWHQGALMEQVLAAHPHLRLKRLPSYSPQLNVGLDHGVGHFLLLLYDAKAPRGQNSNYFSGLGRSYSSTSVSLLKIITKYPLFITI